MTAHKVGVIALVGLVAVLAASVVVLVTITPPTADQLDHDLTAVRKQIVDAQGDTVRLGGLLKVLADARLQTLQNTQAMLEQKRYSLLRFIDLKYVVSGEERPVASQAAQTAALADIKNEEKKLSEAQAKRSLYSGGLLLVMSQLNVATEELTLNQLRMKYYSLHYGLPVFAASKPRTSAEPPQGTIVKDKDAL